MKNKWSGYNNVGVCATALMSVLGHMKQLTLPKTLLVMPLVMHDATVGFLSNGNIRKREAAALVATRPVPVFVNFPTRFDDSLAVTLNAVQLLVTTGFARFEDGLALLQPLEVDSTFGKRAQRIAKASENIAALLASPVDVTCPCD